MFANRVFIGVVVLVLVATTFIYGTAAAAPATSPDQASGPDGCQALLQRQYGSAFSVMSTADEAKLCDDLEQRMNISAPMTGGTVWTAREEWYRESQIVAGPSAPDGDSICWAGMCGWQ